MFSGAHRFLPDRPHVAPLPVHCRPERRDIYLVNVDKRDMGNNEKLVDRFDVVSGSTGKHQRIWVYQEFIDTSTFSEPDSESPGLCRIVTSEETPVRRIDDKTFEVSGTGEILRKI